MVRNRTSKIAAAGVVGGLSIAMAVAFGPTAYAAAPGHSGHGSSTVPTSITAGTVPATSVFGGNTPDNTPVTVSFVLKMKGRPSLANAVERGQSPNLSVQQFASRYGQSPTDIKKLTDYLAGFGITSTVYANGINVSASGTAGQFNKALQITEKNVKIPGHKGTHGHPGRPPQKVHVPNRAPLLPHHLASMVTAILGLSNYAPFTSQSVHVTPRTKPATAASGAAQACPMVSGANPVMCHLPSDFAKRYGVNPLYQQGFDGSGQTIGIVTLAAYDPGAAQTFWKALNVPDTGRTVTVQNIDGGPGAPSDAAGSGETDLDVEQSGGVAPGANVIVYQAPNSDSGWADAFFTAAVQNTAGSVSSSWGESETIVRAAVASGVETPALQNAFDEAFLELAAQGQSTFLSAGDSGAYTASRDLGSTDVSAGAIADSPFITSAGGTTLPWTGTFTGAAGSGTVDIKAERAWGWDYLWPALAAARGGSEESWANQLVVGGGGGYSTVERRPAYQQGISGIGTYSDVEYLKPIDYQNVSLNSAGTGGISVPTGWSFNANPSVATGASNSRMQPDVSADADPETGYLLYEPSAATAKPAAAVWQAGWGGTSFVAPQFNGSTAVIDQALGHRVGLWNPAMYRLAKGSNSPVTPLSKAGTDNDNLFFTGTPGTLYNPATGLGTPNLSKFADELK